MFNFLKRLKIDPKSRLKENLGNFSLPTFPSVVLEALDKIRHPKSDSDAIAKILSTDPGLTVRVLKTVNSAAFSTSRKIENIRQAVAMLGLSQLETMLLSVSVSNALPRENTECYNFNDFWSASVMRATMARNLAAIMCPRQKVDCFTTGLLQDMALPFLVRNYPQEYLQILGQWRSQGGNLADIERSVFDWDHAEAATWLCAEWNLPERLAIMIGGHQGSLEVGQDVPPPVKIVSLLRDTKRDNGMTLIASLLQNDFDWDEERVKRFLDDSQESSKELLRMITG